MNQKDEKRNSISINPLGKFVRAVQMVNFMYKNKISSDDLFVLTKIALEKPIRLRTENDFQMIERYMGRLACGLKIKNQYGINLFKELCRNLYYFKAEINKTVININHEGKTFYVILRGRVSVNIYLPIGSESGQFHQSEVNSLGAGQTFGELALLDDVTRTTATINTQTPCEFACVDRFQFKRILGEIQQKELQEKIDFLKKLSFLKGWFDQDLKTLSYHFDKIQYNRHQEIFKEGQEAKYIYIINQGEFLLQKSMEFIPTNPELTNKDINKCIRQIQNIKTLVICKMNQGELFGEEELIGLTVRQYTVKANVFGSEVYRISKIDLERRLWYKSSMTILQNLIKEKIQWRTETYNQQKQVLSTEFELKLHDRNKELVQLKNLLNPQLNKESLINTLEQRRVYQNITKQIQIQRVGQKPSNMIFNFLEAGQTLDYFKESQNQSLLKDEIKEKKKTLPLSFGPKRTKTSQPSSRLLKNRTANNSSQGSPIYKKYIKISKTPNPQTQKTRQSKDMSPHNESISVAFEQIDMVNSKLRFLSEENLRSYKTSDLASGERKTLELSAEQRLVQFMNLMDKNYADENIDWGGDGTIEMMEENRARFYSDLQKYAEINKFTQRDIVEASSKKVEALEQEFKLIQEKDQENIVNLKIQQQQIVNKTHNQINKEYFIKQLRQMQMRLRALAQIKLGLIKIRSDQYVDEGGKIVDKKKQQIDEETESGSKNPSMFNFVTKKTEVLKVQEKQFGYALGNLNNSKDHPEHEQYPLNTEINEILEVKDEHTEKIDSVENMIKDLTLKIKQFKRRSSNHIAGAGSSTAKQETSPTSPHHHHTTSASYTMSKTLKAKFNFLKNNLELPQPLFKNKNITLNQSRTTSNLGTFSIINYNKSITTQFDQNLVSRATSFQQTTKFEPSTTVFYQPIKHRKYKMSSQVHETQDGIQFKRIFNFKQL